MVRFFRDSGLPSRRSRAAARGRRQSDRERDLRLESLEPRLALAVVAGLADTVAPVVRSVALPDAGTYGTDRALSFKVNFSEPVNVVGNQADLFLPIEVGYAMRQAQYVSGSGTKSLTFRMNVTANDIDTDGISLGRVNSAAVRDFDFAASSIRDRAGNPASNAIPALNTSRIRVDATGPVVTSYGDFAVKGQQVSLKVTFDGPVTVKGRPTIPVTIGGQSQSLAYAAGSGTKTLTFAVTLPRRASVANPAFRGENGLAGEVILLPAGSDLKDRFGNSVSAVGGAFGKTFTDNGKAAGSRVVVMGTHFEKLGTVSQDELNTILNDEQQGFVQDSNADSWKNHAPPVFSPAKNDVDLYRVAYRSTIPEQGNRPTVAYGLVAIPKGATGALPLVSYQHGQLLLKESAPSQAFSWDKTEDTTPVRYGLTQKQLYDSGYETRLNVAQFAGHGYAVIAADSFGLGNSIELDSFLAKQSAQQACLDMHAASQKLLSSLKLTTDKLFLNGWSTGGLATLAFQEVLEARGVKIDGVSTAAAPSDMEMFVSRMIFNPRPYSTTTVPDGPGNVAIPQAAAFSLGAYGGKPGAALELFGGNYDFARRFFMREFKTLPEFTFRMDVPENPGITTPVMTMDGVTSSAVVSQFITRKFGSDPRAYERSAFAGLIRDAGAGKTRLESDMRTYYGLADEVVPESAATIIDTWQRGTLGKTNIVPVPVESASHGDALLDAAYRQLRWFDIQRGAISSGPVGSLNPITGAPAAVENLTVTPKGIGNVLLSWSPSAGATRYDISINGQYRLSVVNETSAFCDNLDPRTTYAFSVVPRNNSGSGPETKAVFGAAKVDMIDPTTGLMAVGQGGSIWVGTSYGASGDEHGTRYAFTPIANINGKWALQGGFLFNSETPQALATTTGQDGAVWVAFSSRDLYAVERIGASDDRATIDFKKTLISSMTPGLDGSIWAVSYDQDTVQHIVQGADGAWFVEGPGAAINVDKGPSAVTTGKDGSVWVTSSEYSTVQHIVQGDDGKWFVDGPAIDVDKSPGHLITGEDGSIWVASSSWSTVQRISQDRNGRWGVQRFGDRSSIPVDTPVALSPGLDGSIWVRRLDGAVQRIVGERGTWAVQGGAIDVGGQGKALVTALDGSIWANSSHFVQQFWVNPAAPTEMTVHSDLRGGAATLSWKAPAATGGTPVTSYAVTARQGAMIKTDTNWGDTTYTFSGLDFSKGPVSFTVAATNFVGTSPVATLLLGQNGQPIDTRNKTTGITTDGTLIIGDGLDTLGQTYSWEALGRGQPIPFGNTAFEFGLPNQPDTSIAMGQTIPVPRGDYGTVNLAGAAVYYGAQPNVTFTLNYTDGSKGTWTQSISDWADPQNFPGETSLAMSSFNRNDATKGQGRVYLYGYSQGLETGKTLESITLPNNPNVRILDIRMGSSAPTTTGVVTDGSVFVGGLDGQGNAYSFEALGGGRAILFGMTAFDFRLPNQPNTAIAKGQTIPVPRGDFGTVNLAAAAVSGAQSSVTLTLNYTDGTKGTWTQSISDWAQPQRYPNEQYLQFSYYNRNDGTRGQGSRYVYVYSQVLEKGKTLESITLPSNPNVRVLDVKMGSSAPTTTGVVTDGSMFVGGFDGKGNAYSFEALGSGRPIPFGNVAFELGAPNQPRAIIATGQTIPVLRGDYGTVNLAAAAVYSPARPKPAAPVALSLAAQPNLGFTLNYTDGTKGTWTQSISDWAKPQNFPGEKSLALPYYNQGNATQGQSKVYLYGYSQAIERGKTLESITLPNNPDVRILDIQMGSAAPTTTGFVTDGSLFIGGLDGQGNAYSFEALGSGKPIQFGKVSFAVGSPNQPGVIAMAAQTIAVPQGNYRTINIAATAVNGSRQDRRFMLTYTDGSTEIWTQSFSDWASPQKYAGETTIATMAYRNRGDGTKDQRPVNLYGYSRAIPAGKTLKSITLMQTDEKVKILDIKMGT